MKLFEHGVYLVNGNRLVEDGPEAKEQIQSLTGKTVDKKEAAKGTIAYGILEAHNTSGNMEELQIKFDKLTSHDITYVGTFRRRERQGWKNSRFPMC